MSRTAPQHLVSRFVLALAALVTVTVGTTARGASSPVLLKDINTAAETRGSTPRDLVTVGDRLFFTACDRTHGCELWTSDGTPGGTRLLRDFSPGTSSLPRPVLLTPVNGTLFFYASGEEGLGLWKSDGTTEGTVFVRGGFFGSLRDLTDVNGTLYFSVADDVAGIRLWRSDGTTAGTVPISSRIFGRWHEIPLSLFTPVGNLVYFQHHDYDTQVNTLWRTDGTELGTIPLGTFEGTPDVRGVEFLKPLGNVLLFGTATGGVQRLWRSDGTPAGTVAIKDVNVGCGYWDLQSTAVVGGAYYFRGDDGVSGCELWRSDGTPGGTAVAFERFAGTAGGFPGNLAVAGGALFFALGDGGYPMTRLTQLWKSDGTQGGTMLLKDFGPQQFDVYHSTPLGPSLAFVAGEGGLWTTDGTPGGTVLVRDFTVSPGRPTDFRGGATRVYFVAPGLQYVGSEPWVTDLTPAGTLQLLDIFGGTKPSFPSDFFRAGGSDYFVAVDASDELKLFRTNGTEAGTTIAASPRPAWKVGDVGDSVILATVDGLHRVDGGGSTTFLAPVSARQGSALLNGVLYFGGGPLDDSDVELWKTDGTPGGTTRVKDILAGSSGGSGPSEFTEAGGVIYFSAWSDGIRGLWKTDGTDSGTVLVKSDAVLVTPRGSKVVFLSAGNVWVSDGTPAGTQQISSVQGANWFASGANATYFVPQQTSEGQLWKTDGTATGTVLVKDVAGGFLRELVAVGTGVFFVSLQDGYQLWYSDGTQAGTILLRTFVQMGDMPPVRVGSSIYFAASDGASGMELWRSDATPAGTLLAADLVAGSGSGNPRAMTVVGNKLYFRAESDAAGVEPYVMVFDGTPDSFTFADANGVNPGATVTSATVVVAGLEIQVPIRVSGGQYSIGCTGTFTASAGIIDAGQSVCVRNIAGATGSGTTVTSLTVGDFSTSFTSRVADNVFTNPRLFAAQQYRDFLGREGETAGIDFYEQLIANGTMTRRQVIEVFLASPEFQTGLPQVTRLYFAFFGRIPDYAGLMFQAAAYRSGAPLAGIAENFSLSPEFTDRYGALTDEQYVDLAYQNVLGRPADPGGRAYYLERLADGRLTRGQMMIGFSESAEFQQIVSDEVYVIAVYVGMLRRTPEQAGLDFYVNLIQSGLARNAIIEGFLASPEYRGRFLP